MALLLYIGFCFELLPIIANISTIAKPLTLTNQHGRVDQCTYATAMAWTIEVTMMIGLHMQSTISDQSTYVLIYVDRSTFKVNIAYRFGNQHVWTGWHDLQMMVQHAWSTWESTFRHWPLNCRDSSRCCMWTWQLTYHGMLTWPSNYHDRLTCDVNLIKYAHSTYLLVLL